MWQLGRPSRFAAPLSISLCALAAFLGGAAARAEERRSSPVPRLQPMAAAARPAVVVEGPPAQAPDLARRLLAARSAARSPGQPVPQPVAQSAVPGLAAPLSARVGRDVRLVARPGVGTPAQLAGSRLQERVSSADAGEDPDLATARAFLRVNRALLGLRDPDGELALTGRLPDALGDRHLKFEQRWRGLPVWPDELIVHLDRNGDVYLLDGAYVRTPSHLPDRPIVSAADAVRRARESRSQWRRADVSSPELIVYAPGTRPARLAWRFSVSRAPDDADVAVVDASNGAVLAAIPLVMTENVAGSGQDLLGQSRPLNVWNAGGTYVLCDTSKSMFDPTSQPYKLDTTRGAIFILDAQNQPASSNPDPQQANLFYVMSGNANAWNLPDGVSAAFALSKTFDYYHDHHGRNSLDGNGGSINGVVRLGSNLQNAFWRSDLKTMFFGDADTYAGSIDVVGHELTHGVTSNTADLLYQDQSGAMNESFSDIFGEMVEAFTEGANDWLIGSHLTRGGPIRNMANPHQFNDPATMSEFVNTTSDHGGVHTNSGIFNYAFYQLAAGLPGAIGLADAERIYYRALTLHLTKNSQFLDGRLACIQSANEIFGAGSPQAERVAQAFAAAEIPDAAPAPPPPTVPPVAGADSVLFLARNGTNLVLSRRETAKGDPDPGVYLYNRAGAEERPSVSGDGTIGIFVTSDNDACLFPTDGSQALACLGLPGTVASVSMSRDASVFAFVLLSGGQRDNEIAVVDLDANTTKTFALVGPAGDAGSTGRALFADTLDLTANRRFVLYDAFNVLSLSDGTQIGLWSISVIDFVSSQTYSLIPPVEGLDIANPSVAKTSDDYFTFESDDQADGHATVYAARFSTGAVNQVVVNVPSGFVVPSYTGDDRAIVYSYPDSNTPTGRSLAIEHLAADHLTASGNPQQWLSDGAYPVVYRRGAYSTPSGNCTPNATTLCLSGGRFQVTATFTTSQGQQGVGQAVRLTSDTGYFTFFQASNVEVILKVLNACSFSDRIWVFAGGLTNVATVLTVTDTATGVARTYANPQNTAFEPIQDTNAFATCFAGSLEPSVSWTSTAAGSSAEIARFLASRAAARGGLDDMGAGARPLSPTAADACIPDTQTLCLNSGRFRVQTSFRTPQGEAGAGTAVRITEDTGYFWFFNSSNVEMVIKVLNACAFSTHQWVFAGGLTNVEVTTTVTDTQTGAQQVYVNPLNQPFRPLQDTAAFSTCP
ncbi:MAG: M4 family metallopeptidase [Acidobacteriota bacterium]